MWRSLSTSQRENYPTHMPFACGKWGMGLFIVGGLKGGERKAAPPQLLPRIESICEGKRNRWAWFEFIQTRMERDRYGGLARQGSWSVRRWRDCCEGITPRFTVVGAPVGEQVSGGR